MLFQRRAENSADRKSKGQKNNVGRKGREEKIKSCQSKNHTKNRENILDNKPKNPIKDTWPEAKKSLKNQNKARNLQHPQTKGGKKIKTHKYIKAKITTKSNNPETQKLKKLGKIIFFFFFYKKNLSRNSKGKSKPTKIPATSKYPEDKNSSKGQYKAQEINAIPAL